MVVTKTNIINISMYMYIKYISISDKIKLIFFAV